MCIFTGYMSIQIQCLYPGERGGGTAASTWPCAVADPAVLNVGIQGILHCSLCMAKLYG